MHYQKAKKLADRIVSILAPHCDIIEIAGSIRREKQEVGDIEIVCLPKVEFVKTDLFGGGKFQVTRGFAHSVEFIKERSIKGNVNGRYMQLIVKGGATLDLFMPQAPDYFRILAIRTGSADYSREVIAYAWKKKGWCGTPDGLRLIEECSSTKTGWICSNPCAQRPPVWKSEKEFFNWLEIEYLQPNEREVTTAKSTANNYR